MYELLAAAHISPANQRGLYILQRLAQEGVICFAAREGKQPAFALLAEWAPAAKSLPHEEALARLAQRYFTSHGPATLQDFIWWTGLTTADAKAGLEMVKPQLAHEAIDGKTYWMTHGQPIMKDTSLTAYLLPGFDEYLVGYQDRSAMLEASHLRQSGSLHSWLDRAVVIDGQIVGTWKRTIKKDKIVIAVSPFTSMTKTAKRAVAAAASQYGAFHDVPVVLE